MQTPVEEWLTVSEFLHRYKGRVSRNKLYTCIKDGSVLHIKLGRILLPADAFERVMTADIEYKED